MNVEKLGITEIAHRVWIAEGWGNDEPSLSEGHLVTAAVRETARVARAREDALLEALKGAENDFLDINEYWNGGNGSAIEAAQHACEVSEQSLSAVRSIIRQIEESR